MAGEKDHARTTATSLEPASGVGVLLRAALPSLPVVGALPGIRKASADGFAGIAYSRPPVVVDRERVAAYARVCGFPDKDVAPLSYPHLLGFGLQMAIMSDPAFPAPAIGTVHVENAITQHRPVAIGETVAVLARVGAPVPHPKGTVYEFVTEVSTPEGELVWEETSAYLRRGRPDPDASFGTVFPEAAPGGVRWSLGADLGRRYAAVSGDHNPIHLYPLTARALGFRRQIAHGMWTMARCVAALENRLPDEVTVAAGFRRPVFLPGTVAFGSGPADRGYAFSLSDPRNGATHLVGRTSAVRPG